MPVSAERFASEGHFPSYDPVTAGSRPTAMTKLECRCCGYEPNNTVVAPVRCPKCHASCWQRFSIPGSLLACLARTPARRLVLASGR